MPLPFSVRLRHRCRYCTGFQFSVQIYRKTPCSRTIITRDRDRSALIQSPRCATFQISQLAVRESMMKPKQTTSSPTPPLLCLRPKWPRMWPIIPLKIWSKPTDILYILAYLSKFDWSQRGSAVNGIGHPHHRVNTYREEFALPLWSNLTAVVKPRNWRALGRRLYHLSCRRLQTTNVPKSCNAWQFTPHWRAG